MTHLEHLNSKMSTIQEKEIKIQKEKFKLEIELKSHQKAIQTEIKLHGDNFDKEYPFKHTKQARKAWENDEHPKECVGKCKLTDGHLMNTCSGCGWDDY